MLRPTAGGSCQTGIATAYASMSEVTISLQALRLPGDRIWDARGSAAEKLYTEGTELWLPHPHDLTEYQSPPLRSPLFYLIVRHVLDRQISDPAMSSPVPV
jgi:hypothetical protein